MEVFGLAGELQRSIAIAKQSEIFWISNPFAFDRLKFFDDLVGFIRRAIVQHDQPVRKFRLASHRLERSANKLFPVIDRNDCDDIGLHQSQRNQNNRDGQAACARAGLNMECGGKRSATPLWLVSWLEVHKNQAKAASRFACRRTPYEPAYRNA